MFDIGWGELLLIGAVALIAIGPKELPGALRSLGQWVGKIRRMASEFQNQFHEAMREAELHELKKEVDDLGSQASKMANFDPLDDVRREVESAQYGIENAMSGDPTQPAPAATPTSTYGGSGGNDDVSPINTEPPAPAAPTDAVAAAPAESAAAPAPAPVEPSAPPPAPTVAEPAPAVPAKPDTGRAA